MDSIPDWLSVVLLILAVLVSGFFNAAETAFAVLNKYKYVVKAEDGHKTSRLILFFHEKFDATIVTILIGSNALSILISTLSTFLFLHLFRGVIPDATVSLLASIAMAFVLFLFGDTIPKFIAKRVPDHIVSFAVYPLAVFHVLFFPVSIIFYGLGKLFRKIFRAKHDVELTEEDFQSILDEAEETGVIEESESEIIQASFDFADTTVKEVFTPKKKMTCLDLSGLTRDKLLEYLKTTSFSRIPLYYKDENKIVGILIVKNYLNAYFVNPNVPYFEYAEKPYFVTPRVHLDDLLDGFKEHHCQVAIVRKDETVIGMVTMEDVLEELVGRIDEKPMLRRDAK